MYGFVLFVQLYVFPRAAPSGIHITALRVQIPYTLETHGTTITCTLTILICHGCNSCRWSTALTVGCSNCTHILSEWPKSPHCEASLPGQCGLNKWEGLSAWSAGDSVVGDDSIALGEERKVPEEGQISGGSSTLSRGYTKVLRFTSGS